jgi:hypothetical protein
VRKDQVSRSPSPYPDKINFSPKEYQQPIALNSNTFTGTAQALDGAFSKSEGVISLVLLFISDYKTLEAVIFTACLIT